jgi:hypothetical protein
MSKRIFPHRLAATLFAALLGLAATWAMSGVASSIDWPVKPYRGCYEIDACNVPWWIVAFFASWIVGPAVVYAGTAFVGVGRRWKPKQWAVASIVLLLATVALYFSWFAYRAFS